MTAAERRDLVRRLRELGIHVRDGAFEPLTQDAHLTRSPAAVTTTSDRAAVGPVLTGTIRRRLGEVLRVR